MFKIVFMLFFATYAMAAPTIYPTSVTGLSKIKNNTHSNIVSDTIDPLRFYVMPPTVATASVGGLHTMTANLGFCREMADSQSYSRTLLAKVKDLALQEIEAKGEADKMRKSLFTAREEASKFAVQARLQDLADLDTKIDSMESRLSELYAKSNDCQNSCEAINQEIDDLVKNKSDLLKIRREIVKTHASDVRDYERHRQLIINIQANLKDQDDVWLALNRRVMQIRSDFQGIYLTFSKMEGSRAKISFKSDWDQNVARLRADNQNIEFEKIQTQNAVVMSNISVSGDLTADGAIMSYEIGGFNSDG
jgi:hypothetical protein